VFFITLHLPTHASHTIRVRADLIAHYGPHFEDRDDDEWIPSGTTDVYLTLDHAVLTVSETVDDITARLNSIILAQSSGGSSR